MNNNFITKYNKLKNNYNICVVYISFKHTNVFVSINEFNKFFSFFLLNKVLKTYSCGLIDVITEKGKMCSDSYYNLSKKLKLFLLENNFNKIHLMLKSSTSIKYEVLKILLNMLYNCNIIKILSIYFNLSTPYNGCRLQKRKF